MAKAKQYLRVQVGDAMYLFPGATGYAIEQRENLSVEDISGPIAAWRTVRGRRLPAYSLDAGLRPVHRTDWQRAVFIESASGDGAGFVADDVHMLPEDETAVTTFEPLGPPPTPAGHVFAGAWQQDTTPGTDDSKDGGGRATRGAVAGEVERRREQPSKRVVLVFDPRALVAYLQSLGGA
ncbi:MAG: hypothetical protein HY083_08635 [Gammaproteobacteria bacterium]|nr:hypothetical protein [Gammaproteobacteria bacterium]